MNSLVVFAALLAIATASVLPLPVTTLLDGPSSAAQVIGPDGSAIVSSAPGGRILASENLGLAAVGLSTPLISPGAPLLSRSILTPLASPWGSVALQAPLVW